MARFAILATLLFSLSTAFAEPCRLNLVSAKKSPPKTSVQAGLYVKDNQLIVQFDVQTPKIFAPKLGPKQYPYMIDVVEVFVTASDTNFPYYEFEVSPNNDTFQVEILDLKKPFIENADLGLTSVAKETADGWFAELHIPLPPNTNPAKLRGNLYAILGEKPNRSYWSTFLPRQLKPNFHQPQFFASLQQCEIQPPKVQP